MGLDAVEIVMEVEEAFDVTIDEADAEKMLTPRDLIESVMRKIAQADPQSCLTQRAFNLLRKSLLRHLPLERRDIAPPVRLAYLVPKSKRAALLEELAADLKTGLLPALERPLRLVRLLTAQSLTLGIAAGLFLPILMPTAKGGLQFWIGFLVAILAHSVAWVATARSCTEFPAKIMTVGDLARWITAHKADLASQRPGRWTREQVAARVREILIEQLGVESSYREDASLVKDLGLS
jgi:acyl carrier protein